MRLLLPLLAASLSLAQVESDKPAPGYPADAKVEKDVSYDQHPETVMDIVQPANGGSLRRPGVLVIHGGGWRGGSRESVIENFVLPWLAQGFVVANVEYRLSKKAKAPAAVQDALKAAQFFRENAKRWNVDSRRIVVTGGSAGGHLALMVGMTPKSAKLGPESKVAAVVDWYGITDVEDQLQGPNMREYAVEWVPEQENRFEVARRVSPMSYIRKDTPPILCIHGTADENVPYEHSVQLVKALRDEGGDAEMITVPNAAHSIPADRMLKVYPQIFEFLKKREILK